MSGEVKMAQAVPYADILSDIYTLKIVTGVLTVVVFITLVFLMFTYCQTNHFQNMRFTYTNNKHHDLKQLLVPRMAMYEQQSEEPCSGEQGSDESIELSGSGMLQYTGIKKKEVKHRRYGSMFAVGTDHDSDQVDGLLEKLQRAENAGYLN